MHVIVVGELPCRLIRPQSISAHLCQWPWVSSTRAPDRCIIPRSESPRRSQEKARRPQEAPSDQMTRQDSPGGPGTSQAFAGHLGGELGRRAGDASKPQEAPDTSRVPRELPGGPRRFRKALEISAFLARLAGVSCSLLGSLWARLWPLRQLSSFLSFPVLPGIRWGFLRFPCRILMHERQSWCILWHLGPLRALLGSPGTKSRAERRYLGMRGPLSTNQFPGAQHRNIVLPLDGVHSFVLSHSRCGPLRHFSQQIAGSTCRSFSGQAPQLVSLRRSARQQVCARWRPAGERLIPRVRGGWSGKVHVLTVFFVWVAPVTCRFRPCVWLFGLPCFSMRGASAPRVSVIFWAKLACSTCTAGPEARVAPS